MNQPRRKLWLDTAARIADRVAATAEWSAGACTWTVRVPDRIPGQRTAHGEAATGSLYQGTAGIALFLGEAYRSTRAPQHLVTAEGALQYALALAARPAPAAWGFYSGHVGLAYACYRHALNAERPDYLHAAERLLTALLGREREDVALDVIGGAAGAVPALLAMADQLPGWLTSDLAVALGERILAAATRGPDGWSWPGHASAVRNLTGYAHGAAGFAHALLELYRATGDEWYRYGAEQAFAYERRYYDAEAANWPDFRYLELSEYVGYGQVRELRDRLRDRSFPPYTQQSGCMWCHGAPGIGLARLRAFEVLGDAYANEAASAVATTLEAVQSLSSGYSLCHGHLGNCETLLYGARVLGRPELRAAAEDRAAVGRDTFELAGRSWPCGTVGGTPDPSLMLGEAGIGYFYLRLYDDDTPRVLCLTPSATGVRTQRRDVVEVRRQAIEQHFGVTLRAFALLGPGSEIMATSGPLNAPDVRDAYLRIAAAIEAQPTEDRRRLMADAFAVERAAFEMRDAPTDTLAVELLADVARPAASELDWACAVLQRDPRVILVRTRRDWANVSLQEISTLEVGDDPVSSAVWRYNRAVATRRLSDFAALVLDCAAEPGAVADIVRRVAMHADASAPARVAAAVRDQLVAAYSAGLVRTLSSLAEIAALPEQTPQEAQRR